MENTFRPSRFLSLRATTPSPCTWEEIMQELTGERHAATTTLFRALAAGEGQDAETSKRQQSQIKQNQPAFVCEEAIRLTFIVEENTTFSTFSKPI